LNLPEKPRTGPQNRPKMALICGDGVCAIPSWRFATRVGTS
jgi:hypothetical protein